MGDDTAVSHRAGGGTIKRLGSPEEDGSVHMVPFIQELLSQYVGTSRERVTVRMAQFRRHGYLRYSRKAVPYRFPLAS